LTLFANAEAPLSFFFWLSHNFPQYFSHYLALFALRDLIEELLPPEIAKKTKAEIEKKKIRPYRGAPAGSIRQHT